MIVPGLDFDVLTKIFKQNQSPPQSCPPRFDPNESNRFVTLSGEARELEKHAGVST